MKAPFLGHNNGRYVTPQIAHGQPAMPDLSARSAVIMRSNGALLAAKRNDDAAPLNPKPRAGRIEFDKSVTFYSKRQQKMVTIEVTGWVIQKAVEPEPTRNLCAEPAKEKPQSRNASSRTYHWAGNYASGMVKGSVGRAKLKVEKKVGQVSYPERHLVRAAWQNWQGGRQK